MTKEQPDIGGSRREAPGADHVDHLMAQWKRERPEMDTGGMAIIGRARRITLLTRPAIEAVFARHGLDTGEFDVLTTLRRAGAPFCLTPTELYRALMISSGGLTDRLARLEAAGLVERRQSDKDKRSFLVFLTPAGRERADLAFEEDMATEKTLLACYSETEKEQLASLLRKFLDRIEGGDAP